MRRKVKRMRRAAARKVLPLLLSTFSKVVMEAFRGCKELFHYRFVVRHLLRSYFECAMRCVFRSDENFQIRHVYEIVYPC